MDGSTFTVSQTGAFGVTGGTGINVTLGGSTFTVTSIVVPWVEEVPVFSVTLDNPAISPPVTISQKYDISTLENSRYLLTVIPINNYTTILTSAQKSFTTILQKTGTSVLGGSTLFLSTTDFITISPDASSAIGGFEVVYASMSASAERFSINLRKIT